MNYRHGFHAGNFADCVKHALLVWLVRALQHKPAPLFVLDTYAGIVFGGKAPDDFLCRRCEFALGR